MKKNFVIVALCMCALLLAGCGNETSSNSKKTLTCTSTEGKLAEEITFTFEDDAISKVKGVYTSTQDSASAAEENKDNLQTLITATYGTPSYSNYELDVKVSGSKIIGTMNVDYSKASDTLKSALSSSTSYNDVKKEYEDNGSTCK